MPNIVKGEPKGSPKTAKVLIAIPSAFDFWHVDFARSLTLLMAFAARVPFPKYDHVGVDMCVVKSSLIALGREQLVSTAQNIGATHIFFLDSDQIVIPETLHEMLGAELPVVALNIPTRSIPAHCNSRVANGTADGAMLYTDPTSVGFRRVLRTGTGVMLIDMRVFDRIGRPWFQNRWTEELGHQGEDYWFCQRCREENIPIYVNQGLSRSVGHVGTFVYTHDVVGEVVKYPTKGEAA